jgi:UDP-glucose:(heptosyl)LPS alpha-1,3-glucosyltransferase
VKLLALVEAVDQGATGWLDLLAAVARAPARRTVLPMGGPARMRVALALDRFEPARGGLESYAARLAGWLLEAGHVVHAVAFAFAEDGLPPGLIRHPLPRPPGRMDRARAVTEGLAMTPVDVIHDFGVGWRFDVLQILGGSRRSALHAQRRASPLRERLGALVNAWREWRGDELERRRLAPGPGRIVAASAMVKAQLVADYGVAPHRITIVPNGVDTERFSPTVAAALRPAARARLEFGDQDVVFLFVGRNYRLKGLAPALRAIATLGADGRHARCVVLGAVSDAGLEGLVAASGVAGRVRLCGAVADPRPYYAAADVVLHPTFYDTGSLAVLEGWAMGLPAITTRRNGVAELWPADVPGWIVDDPRKGRALTAALRGALDPARRAEAGRRGREVAVRHDETRAFARLAAIYEDIVEARTSAAR